MYVLIWWSCVCAGQFDRVPFVQELSLIAKALARRIRGLAARTYAHRGRGGRFKGTTAACSRYLPTAIQTPLYLIHAIVNPHDAGSDNNEAHTLSDFPGPRPKPHEMKAYLDDAYETIGLCKLTAVANGKLPSRVETLRPKVVPGFLALRESSVAGPRSPLMSPRPVTRLT